MAARGCASAEGVDLIARFSDEGGAANVNDFMRLEERRYRSIFESAAVALAETDLRDITEWLDRQRELGVTDIEAWLKEEPGRVAEAARLLRVLDVNEATLRLFDASSKNELLGSFDKVLRAGMVDGLSALLSAMAEGRRFIQLETEGETLQQRKVSVLVAVQIPERHEELQNVIFSLVDITERKELQQQMQTAQRMEAVGRLAGGVAHDFNNLLTVIGSYAGFLLDRFAHDPEAREDLETIQEASDRASALTHQLLAFSRRQVQQPRIVEVNDVVRELHRMLRRLIGEDIALEMDLDPRGGAVHIDPSHLEQVLMNLVVNARDAMPRGGTLRIETASTNDVQGPSGPAGKPKLRPCMRISVSDTGTGMDEATQAKIFEPFFTTKAQGKGTGLGLSTVYGIVTQSGGQLGVQSKAGKGTRFDILLPRVEPRTTSLTPRQGSEAPHRGSETVLLVEDQEMVRRAAQRALERAGYRVLSAEDAEHAMQQAAAAPPGTIDLLLTDVVMPRVSGRQLAQSVRGIHPDMRVLYMSGYTDDSIVEHGVLQESAFLLPKPFSPDRLLKCVREVLDFEDPSA